MRWVARILALMVVLAAGAGTAQQAPAKLALVIGNADYDGDARIDVSEAGVARSEAAGYVPDLRNPLNDAADIRDALRGIGFAVSYVENADGAGMSTALANFGAKVAEAPTNAQVVIYYAGHAIQVDGANFLIPVKAQLPAADFSRMPSTQAQTILGRVAVSTGEVLDQFREPSAPGVNLLILDSCRNNPWERRMRGLSRTAAQTRGMADLRANIARTIVAFATQPGDVAQDGGGRNSPFASALKRSLAKPGNVLQMLDGVGSDVQAATGSRQTPWFQSASIGETCLARCTSPTAAQEEALYNLAMEVGDFASVQAYLDAYPNGLHVAEVRKMLEPVPTQRWIFRPASGRNRSDPVVLPTVPPDALQFAVYFEWGVYNAPISGFEVIYAALERCAQPPIFAIVRGHDDTSRVPERAMNISRQRAMSIAGSLSLRVPPEAVYVEALGGTENARPTRAGVREPLNRRVQVVLACTPVPRSTTSPGRPPG